MIFHPKIGQLITINYKDKSMPYQGCAGRILAKGVNRGPKNVLVLVYGFFIYAIIPRGNLNAIR